jgi:hypothetical protein
MKPLAGIVPFITLALLWIGLARRSGSWRTSALAAASIWAVALTTLTEGLSLFRAVSFGWVLAAWMGGLAVAAAALISRTRNAQPMATDAGSRLPSPWWLAVTAVVVIVALTGLIALVAPPNTTDSMTYHMARVVHWIQNHSVAHYPTHIAKQLHLAPWAEFTILHLQILSGGDRFANLVQWLAMIGSLVGVSLIAKQLGGDVRCQLLAVVVSATVPMGILQSSSTQNDYVVTFWLVCFVYQVFAYLNAESETGDGSRAWWIGCSLGLAILTKATAYVVALPFLVWMVLDAAWHRRPRLARTIAIVSVAVVALNAGHAARNIQIYGTPLGPGREGQWVYANERFDVAALASNIVRNVAVHLGTSNEPINRAIERGVAWFHARIGADVNDPRTTWLGTPFQVAPLMTHEDLAGNLIHLMLIAATIAMALMTRALRTRADVRAYVGLLIAGCLLFALYLKWQPWHSRLHLPFFVLWSPLIAVVWGSRALLAGFLAGLLLLAALPAVVANESRPLLGSDSVIRQHRTAQYFANRRDLIEPYAAAIRYLAAAGCARVGLWTEYEPEYQLWVLGSRRGRIAPPRIEHLGVTNESARAPFPEPVPFDPCALLVITPNPDVPASVTFNDSVYDRTLRTPPVNILVRR